MSTEDARKLFVAGLPESVTEDVLRQLFEATGSTVISVSLPKDRTTGRPRGFGFVTLSSSEEAESARGALDGSLQAGRAISVRPFQSEPPRRGDARSDGAGPPSASAAASGSDRTLYVGNLPYDTTQKEVEDLFAESGAGPVVRVHLPSGPDGRLRGFGFVTLGSSEAANEAIAALRTIELRGRRLMVNIAHPRGERSDRPDRGDRPRPRPRSDDGSLLDARGGDRMPDPPDLNMPDFGETRRGEGRRRAVKGGGERGEGGEGKRGKKTQKRTAAAPERKGRSRSGWQDWEDWDED
jgi:RNA recognition motif-containing protein